MSAAFRAGTDAAMIVTVNSIVGAVSSGLSGIVSDMSFKGSRQELAVAAGVLNVTALVLFMFAPGRYPWLDVTAMVMFGLAGGILLTFLGRLMAVDRVPKCAAGWNWTFFLLIAACILSIFFMSLTCGKEAKKK